MDSVNVVVSQAAVEKALSSEARRRFWRRIRYSAYFAMTWVVSYVVITFVYSRTVPPPQAEYRAALVTTADVENLRMRTTSKQASILGYLSIGDVGFVRDAQIVEIVGSESCWASVGIGKDETSAVRELVLLEGFDTSQHVDGDDIGSIAIKVVSKETYTPQNGEKQKGYAAVFIPL